MIKDLRTVLTNFIKINFKRCSYQTKIPFSYLKTKKENYSNNENKAFTQFRTSSRMKFCRNLSDFCKNSPL